MVSHGSKNIRPTNVASPETPVRIAKRQKWLDERKEATKRKSKEARLEKLRAMKQRVDQIKAIAEQKIQVLKENFF
jgi:hypothetical protein